MGVRHGIRRLHDERWFSIDYGWSHEVHDGG